MVTHSINCKLGELIIKESFRKQSNIRMRIPGLRRGYARVPDQEAQGPQDSGESGESVEVETEDNFPLDPPEYDSGLSVGSAGECNSTIEQMEYEEEDILPNSIGKIRRFRDNFSNNIVIPVREKIVDPLAEIIRLLSDKIDYHLNKVGNPLILRRFFYIVFMSIIAYVIMVSGLLPTEKSLGNKGMFADYEILMSYVRNSVDLSKLERDLEYISSMPHMSGTRGDSAVRNYVFESFTNNGVNLIKECNYNGYSNYPDEVSLKAIHDGQETVIDVNQDNFNPLSKDGELHDMQLIFASQGSLEDLEKLNQNGLLSGDFVLLEYYSSIVSEQVLAAEKYGAKGILFITEKRGGYEEEVQKMSVGKPQIFPGDPLTPGWADDTSEALDIASATNLPYIPTIPLSWNQGSKILGLLSRSGVQFDDSTFSGQPGDVIIDMKVKNVVRERHPVDDFLGKIEGAEQSDKAIVIGASRTGVGKGCSYPSFGTAILLSILQLFQELKYKFDWKPLRNIYFASYGGTEFNLAGAVELFEENSGPLKDEIYSVIDLSQLTVPIEDRKLDIQSHPLLQEFFENEENRFGYNVDVRNVQEYGDWTPLMANGIPVSAFSSSAFLEAKPPLHSSGDEFNNIRESFHDNNQRQAISDLLLFIFQSALKIVDDPLIPFSVVKYVHTLDDAIQDLTANYPEHLDTQEVIKSLLLWKKIGEEWVAWSKGWDNIVMARDEGVEPSLLSVHRWAWNKKLADIGRRQCKNEGLPNRPFYKNVLFGPAYWTQSVKGDAWIFPSVKDAVVDEDWDRAQNELNSIAQILEQSAGLFLDETNDI